MRFFVLFGLVLALILAGCASTPQQGDNASAESGGGAATQPSGSSGNASGNAGSSGGAVSDPIQDAKGDLLSPEDVAMHADASSCYVRYLDQVYDLTAYIGKHPGGAGTILPFCGKSDDSFTNTFVNVHPGNEYVVTLMNEGAYKGYME